MESELDLLVSSYSKVSILLHLICKCFHWHYIQMVKSVCANVRGAERGIYQDENLFASSLIDLKLC